jgi:hypothetical protein
VQRLGDHLLGAAVGVRGVDQVDTEPNRLPQHVAGRTRALGLDAHTRHSHRPEPEPMDAQLATDREGAGSANGGRRLL